VVFLLLLALACAPDGVPDTGGGGAVTDGGAASTGGDSGGDGGASGDTGADACADAQTVTWASWGQGFLLEACQGCHASTSTNRYDAPEDVVFDTVDDAWNHAARILARAAADPPTMPPMGGTTEDDRTRLQWWLLCGTPGT